MLGRMVSNLMSWIFGVLIGFIVTCGIFVQANIVDWDKVHKLAKWSRSKIK
jgi:hypothetical protein